MTLEQVFFRTWRVISLPLFLIVLLFCYYTLPDSVAVHHNNLGLPDGFVDKQTVFYVVGLLIIFFNILMSAFKNVIVKLPDSFFIKQKEWAENRPSLNRTLVAWTDLFVGFVNSYIIICLIGLNRINRNTAQTLDINYNWVLLLGAVLLMIIIFYLPIKLLFTKPQEEMG